MKIKYTSQEAREREVEILKKYKDGMSLSDIGESLKYKLKKERVRQILTQVRYRSNR